jgi:hypothetical protein
MYLSAWTAIRTYNSLDILNSKTEKHRFFSILESGEIKDQVVKKVVDFFIKISLLG